MKQTVLSFAPVKPKPMPKVDPVDIKPLDEGAGDPAKIYDSPEEFSKCLEPSWRKMLAGEFTKPYFVNLLKKVKSADVSGTVFPPKQDMLNAFKYCPFDQVKVVIIGQDPYKNPGEAHGLSFSVRKGVRVPPSLRNIYTELSNTYGTEFIKPNHGCLESWAKQGILLLNATLTLNAGQSNSHKDFGWNNFTNAAISAINNHRTNVVFLAWGKFAQDICRTVDQRKHLVLSAAHPSPLAGNAFLGCDHFRKCNKYLLEHGQSPIKWNSICES